MCIFYIITFFITQILRYRWIHHVTFCLATSAGFVKLSTNMAANVKLPDIPSCFSLNVGLYVCVGMIEIEWKIAGEYIPPQYITLRVHC